MMDDDKLKTKVTAVLTEHPDWTDQEITDSLNEPSVTETYSRFITFRTLLSVLPMDQGMRIITTIRAAAVADPNGVLGVIVPSLEGTADGCGVDMKNENARLFIDGLVAAAGLLAEDGAAVKGMSERQVSWGVSEKLGRLRVGDIQRVRV